MIVHIPVHHAPVHHVPVHHTLDPSSVIHHGPINGLVHNNPNYVGYSPTAHLPLPNHDVPQPQLINAHARMIPTPHGPMPDFSAINSGTHFDAGHALAKTNAVINAMGKGAQSGMIAGGIRGAIGGTAFGPAGTLVGAGSGAAVGTIGGGVAGGVMCAIDPTCF